MLTNVDLKRSLSEKQQYLLQGEMVRERNKLIEKTILMRLTKNT